MEKRISFDEFQSVKRVAQACNPLMMKREKVKQKIAALAAEYKSYDNQIQALEAGIKQLTGFRVEELVRKEIEAGKTTRYLPSSIVSYDSQKKQYVIEMSSAGNDFDQDREAVAAETEEEVVFN